MGAIRFIFGWIFILYGAYVLIGNTIGILGVSALQFTNPTDFVDIQGLTIDPNLLLILNIVGFLWGALWLWIGNKVRTGGQQVQRFSKRK
ncbi:MAG: hypothetical protein KJI69_04045 [Patescibacteria group bacterium]|nr:hypothetical protein [Patescibacteria group bacterium]